jgi:hypothetical protein
MRLMIETLAASNYYAVPTNSRASTPFITTGLSHWLRCLRRRSRGTG